jgi:uncharacterized membrane protein (DUF4010 family)
MSDLELLGRLSVALMLGLLIGMQRTWALRDVSEGGRIAGVRTFGLIALYAALCDMLGQRAGIAVLALGLAGLAILVTAAQILRAQHAKDFGLTTTVAALLTFTLGALTMEGYVVPAVATAVVATLLLELKPRLHGWISHIAPDELYSTLKFLIITLVILPVLPNRTYGPGDVFNPFEIWLYVVLISTISFAGYIAVKLVGVKRGILLTAMGGGLFASTAVALNYSRFSRGKPELHRLLAGGIVAASATMFLRMLVIVGVVSPPLLTALSWPLAMMAATGYVSAVLLAWKMRDESISVRPFENPFELRVALQFGALLAVVMILAKLAPGWLGDAGVMLLSAFSGIADVDAITISLSRLVGAEISFTLATRGILLAALVNTIFKAILAIAVSRCAIGWQVAAAAVAMIGVGTVTHIAAH